MESIVIVFFLILLVYIFYIIQLIIGYDKIKTFIPKNLPTKNTFTIIVPFRNESKNLPKLLNSFSKLNYPTSLLQIIMVDDFSEDNSSQIYNRWRMDNESIDTTLLENLHLSNSPKKDAINRAIQVAKHEWIITTDADCIVPKNWLKTLDNYIQINDVEMVVGAVKYKTKNNWFHHFQQLDLMSLQGVTIGSFGNKKPFMCNGANLAYTKNLFQKLGGFDNNNLMASGDDVFLLQKAYTKYPEKTHYLKNPDFIVKTKPENDLWKLFMQRVRWASKTTQYHNAYAKKLAVVVLLMNISLIGTYGLWALGWFNKYWLFGIFSGKYAIDYSLLKKTNKYIRKDRFLLPIASSILYPFFSSLVGIYALFGKYTWKDRSFKK